MSNELMSIKKVLFIDSVHPNMWAHLSAQGYACIHAESLSYSEVQPLLAEAHGLIIRSRFTLDKEFLSTSRQLRWIARSGVGMENIDTDYCQSRGIKAFNAQGGNAPAVGEHVVGMLLTLFHKIHLGDRAVRSDNWNREAHRGIELGSRTVGIIGYGHTGKAVAKRLGGFGCQVLAFDKYASVDDGNAISASLEEIKSKADVISFHVPLTAETQHYLGDAFIREMKQPFYVVNASRGPVVSTRSLVDGLESGTIIGACLDVLEEEEKDFELKPEALEHLTALKQFPAVLFTPHVAGWTTESYAQLAEVLLTRIQEIDLV
jgi:D-3-phosphoglycerate dehydrogenase